MTGIDLFSGAGGMSLGAKLAGIDVCIAIEADRHAADTYAHNHPETNLIVSDIRKIKKVSFSRPHHSSILFGGPPCQGFSTSNQRTRSLNNPANWLFSEFLRFVNLLKPDWVVFENVKGIVETEKGIFLENVLNKLTKFGYTLSYEVLNAVDYGVPQNRSRLFIIGSLHGAQIEMPKPTSTPPVSVYEAIADLPDMRNGEQQNWKEYKSLPKSRYAKYMRGNVRKSPNHLVTKNAPHIIERFKYVPQGGNWENIPAKLMNNYTDRTRCHTGIYHRLKNDAPSIVIGNYRKNMLIHPYQERGLSVREAARLQSFPDSYEFVGSLGFQQQQVGNAVPPLLAKAVFKAILNS